MSGEAIGHQHLLKDINRMALVRCLCANPGLSRADAATAVGLTKSTVTMLVRELLAEGWLVEREIIATGDLGRRPTPLFIDPSRLLLMGAEVGVDSVRVVATSLTGEVLARSVASVANPRSAKAGIGGLSAALSKVHRQLDSPRQQVIGIGVALPGGVDEQRGVLRFAPNLGWRDVPVGALLAEKLAGTPLAGTPLFVQNDADVAALGEMEFNRPQTSDPLLYIYIDRGLGAGVIVDDKLLTGNCGFAGEVGHVVLQVNGPLCSCGRRGCAEALIGLRAMLRASDDEPTVAEVERRLAMLDADTVRAVRKAGGHLGVLLQNLAAAYDPGCIVLGGPVVGLGDAFLDPALKTLNDYASAANLAPPTVQVSHFGADAVAIGAAALVRYRVTRPMINQRTPMQEAA